MKKIILAGIIIFSMISCSIEYYPTTYNVPLFTGMEQFEATASYGNGGFGGQIAYAPINHFGFIATGSFVDKDESNFFFNNGGTEDGNLDPDFHKHLFGEAGLGYFTGMGSKGSFEIYGGYGRGRTEGFNEDFDTDYDKATYSKFFLQPEIGITNHIFEGAFISRLSAVDMKSNVNNYQTFAVFFEPGFVFKVGYKYVKYYTQIGFSVPMFMDQEDLKYDYSIFNVSVGLNFSFGGYNNK